MPLPPTNKRPWFRAKRWGYGTGLPVAWQGWALLLSHMIVVTTVALLLKGSPLLMIPATLIVLLAPLPLYAARTDGGWTWRWGK
jgi:hypothetical protein